MSSDQPVPEWVQRLNGNSNVSGKGRTFNLIDPPGFTPTTSGKKSKQSQAARKGPTSDDTDTLKVKKAWELAISPAKQLPMNAIGMYMTGNSLQMFSIMMVFMLFKTPITAILNLNLAFARFESEKIKDRILLAKLAYIATNLLAVGLGLWKVNQMGLLPTTRSDWLAWEVAREPLERAFPAFSSLK